MRVGRIPEAFTFRKAGRQNPSGPVQSARPFCIGLLGHLRAQGLRRALDARKASPLYGWCHISLEIQEKCATIPPRVYSERMVTFELLGLYIAFGGSVIFVLLFGGLPAFQGTSLGTLHWHITEGLFKASWWAHLPGQASRGQARILPHQTENMPCRRATQRAAGAQATHCIEAFVARHCCSTSPVLQVLYTLLLAGGWFLYCRELFCFLPQPHAPLWHQ